MGHPLQSIFAGARELASWQGLQGSAHLYTLSHDVIFVDLKGDIGADSTPMFEVHLDRAIASGASLIFWSIPDVRSYAAEARDALFSVFRRRHPEIRAVHLYSRSSRWSIKMAIKIGSLILKGKVKTYEDYEEFAKVLEQVLE